MIRLIFHYLVMMKHLGSLQASGNDHVPRWQQVSTLVAQQ
jgi:hypothetical protein